VVTCLSSRVRRLRKPNKAIKHKDTKSLACAPSSLSLAKHFVPLMAALGGQSGMGKNIETRISDNHIYIRTPGRYAMGLAIELLSLFDQQIDYSVKNTGWKNGFGLNVCERYPVVSSNLTVELETDGEELEIHLVSGGLDSFADFVNLVQGYVNEQNT